MESQKDIICFSLSRSDSAISSPALSLAKEFAKHNRVFFIDHPFSWKDYFSKENKSSIESRRQALLFGKAPYSNPSHLPSNITVVTPRLTLPVNFLAPGFLYDVFSVINDRIIASCVHKVIRDFKVKDFVFINFFDPYFLSKLPAGIKPWRSVYQSMDDISQVAYSHRHGTRLERECVKNFDYTLCTSHELTRLQQPYSPNVFFHPNAADTSIFNKAITEPLPRPTELENIHTPIIGFTGSIEYRSDFELLRKIALHHTDKTLVFVGPVQTNEHSKVGLDKMANVLFTGPKKITELPNYLKYFDCTIIPFVKNTLTKSIYPLKINEYLAAGRPVIAVNFSEDMYSFHEVAYVEDTHEAFINAIDRAINENSPQKIEARMKVAAQNTWTTRVQRFWEIISPEPLKNAKS